MQNKFQKYFFLLILIASCTATVNIPEYDKTNQFSGLLSGAPSSSELGASISLELKELKFIGPEYFKDLVVESYAWDFDCDGVEEVQTTIPSVTYNIEEKGTYTPCGMINFYLRTNPEVKRMAIIRENDFNDTLVVFNKIASFELETDLTELKAGFLDEEKPIKIYAKDSDGVVIPYASFKIEANNVIFYKKIGTDFVETSSFRADEFGELTLYLRANEIISLEEDILESVNLKVSSLIDETVKFEEVIIIKTQVPASIEVLSLGGVKQHRCATDARLDDFGEVKIKLKDEYGNPVCNENIEVIITNVDGTVLSREWRLYSEGLGEGLSLEGVTVDKTNFIDAGTFSFKVLMNDDVTFAEAKVTVHSNDLFYSFNVSFKDAEIGKIEACCGEVCSTDPNDCNLITSVADPDFTNTGTGFKVRVLDGDNNPLEGVPIYVKLKSGTGSPLGDYNCPTCSVEEDIANYGPSLKKKELVDDYRVEFYSDQDSTHLKEKLTPYLTDAEGKALVPISSLVAGKLKSENAELYGLRLSYLVAPNTAQTGSYVDFKNIKVNPKIASNIAFNEASLLETDVDTGTAGTQWYKVQDNIGDILVEIVDKFGNLVPEGEYSVRLTMVNNLSDEDNQSSPIDGNFYVDSVLSNLGAEQSKTTVAGIASFLNTKYADRISYPLLNKLYAFTNISGLTKRVFEEIAFVVTVTGDKESFTADGVSFNMVYIEGGLTTPTGSGDVGIATVSNAYWIGETEITYELWYTVRQWAIANGYSFGAGREGHGGGIGVPGVRKLEPVVFINWRDNVVFSNAVTEWYNFKNSTNLEPVYYSDASYTTLIKTADASPTITYTTPGSQDAPYVKASANGFRLASVDEQELAARYKGIDSSNGAIEKPAASNKWWTPGTYASGATANYFNSAVTQTFAWYNANSGAVTHAVKGKTSNALGIYDMSGNVFEWNFEWHPNFVGTKRIIRGGSWDSSNYNMCVYYFGASSSSSRAGYIGARLARSN